MYELSLSVLFLVSPAVFDLVCPSKTLLHFQGKEWLITELRKELNVTDTEHGQLLVKINSDESIKRIRCLCL